MKSYPPMKDTMRLGPYDIITQYMEGTAERGAAILARDGNRNWVIISYPFELTGKAAHRKAAKTLQDLTGSPGDLVSGSMGVSYAFSIEQPSERPE
jgi:hypothetical protein